MSVSYKFSDYLVIKEGNVSGSTNFEQPHEIKADPPMKVPEGLQRLAEAFKKSKEVPIAKEIDPKAGGEKDVTLKSKKLYVVGGAVRDYMLGQTPRNYDLCTDAHPEEVVRIMKNSKPAITVLKQDPKNGVVKVSVDGEEYEINTLCKKGTEGEKIFSTNTADDTQNRDLTINSLYYDLIGDKIVDHVGGIRHLKDGVVKFNGKASEKLKENPMHRFRAVRFANQHPNGKIDDEDKKVMAAMSDDDSDSDLPPDKVREEFLRGLENAHTNTKKFLKSYEEMGLLQKVFPKLELSLDFPDQLPKSRAIILACLLKDNKPAKLVARLKELKYTDREVKDAVFLINLLWFDANFIYDFKKEILNTSLTKRQIVDWAKMNQLDKNLIEKLVDYKLQVNGNDLIDREGLQGDELRDRIRGLEAENFKKTLREEGVATLGQNYTW